MAGGHCRVLEHLLANAKVELIKLFYGARPTVQLLWKLVVSSEIIDASNLLLAYPEFAGHSAMYGARSSSVFSGIAAILSHIENKALMVLCDKVLAAVSVSEILIFEGLHTNVQRFFRRGEARGSCGRGELHRWRGVRDESMTA